MDNPVSGLQETGMDLSRELLAYAIIGVVLLIGGPALGVMLHRCNVASYASVVSSATAINRHADRLTFRRGSDSRVIVI